MMENYIAYWIKSVNIPKLKKNINGRPVYVWGAFSGGRIVYDILCEHSILVDGFIDGHKTISEYCGHSVYLPSRVLPSKDHYIIIAVKGIRKEIMRYLQEHQYQESKDFLYFSADIPEVEITSVNKYYKDINNNEIIYQGGTLKCQITCIGYDNFIFIDEGFQGEKGLHLIVENGGTIRLGKYLRTSGEVRMEATNGGNLKIGENCYFMKDTRISAQEGIIMIGDYVTAAERFLSISSRHSPVHIGNDCMFSQDVTVLSTDSHSMLDLLSKKNISLDKEKEVRIGNHVWIGKNVIVLYNSEIGPGGIIGAGSVVKGVYPENSVIAGNIAKVVREKCTWDRRRNIQFEER